MQIQQELQGLRQSLLRLDRKPIDLPARAEYFALPKAIGNPEYPGCWSNYHETERIGTRVVWAPQRLVVPQGVPRELDGGREQAVARPSGCFQPQAF